MFTFIVKFLAIIINGFVANDLNKANNKNKPQTSPDQGLPLKPVPNEPKALIEPLNPSIDWTNPKSKITDHFSVNDALWLPQWNRLASEADGLTEEIKFNLIKLFYKMEEIRAIFNRPIIIHITYRPEEYNKLVKGAPNSMHKFGSACDFHIKDLECDEVRKQLVPLLDKYKLRMENLPGSNWVHLDTKEVPVGAQRFFKP